MKTRDTRYNASSFPKSPIKAAAVPISIFVGLYLAAGGIQGLRPMRYEKRVARNRFIALVVILFLTLLGIIAVFVRHR